MLLPLLIQSNFAVPVRATVDIHRDTSTGLTRRIKTDFIWMVCLDRDTGSEAGLGGATALASTGCSMMLSR